MLNNLYSLVALIVTMYPLHRKMSYVVGASLTKTICLKKVIFLRSRNIQIFSTCNPRPKSRTVANQQQMMRCFIYQCAYLKSSIKKGFTVLFGHRMTVQFFMTEFTSTRFNDLSRLCLNGQKLNQTAIGWFSQA